MNTLWWNENYLNTIMKELKQSETRIIKRSKINLNPINPKRHSDERVKLQKKNLQKVGFLGGIVWNGEIGKSYRRASQDKSNGFAL